MSKRLGSPEETFGAQYLQLSYYPEVLMEKPQPRRWLNASCTLEGSENWGILSLVSCAS